MQSPVMKFTILLIVLTSQLAASELKKWGEVPPEHLSMTSYPADTAANAVKLFEVGDLELKISDGFHLYLTKHFQIKILKEGGKDQADVVIPYWHEDNIKKIKAHTILPNGKKVKVKKIFDEESKNSLKVKKLTFPQVEVGSILELEYELHSKYVHSLEPWTFQSELPTLESALAVKIAPGFKYHTLTQNDDLGRITASTNTYYNREYGARMDMYIWQATDLPAIRSEPYISSLENYEARLIFSLDSYHDLNNHITLAKDIKTLINELLDNDTYKHFLKPVDDVRKLAVQQTEGLTSDEITMERLYNFVRDEFEDESYGGYYPRKKQDDILKEKKASATERNLLLLAMLRAVNLEAWPMLISTRNHGWVDPRRPFLDQYNRSVVFSKTSDGIVVLDASDKFTVFGGIPFNSYFNQGLMLDQEHAQYVTNTNEGLKSEETFELETGIDSQGKITGKAKMWSAGFASRNRNDQLDGSDDVRDFLLSYVGDDFENIEITDLDSTLSAAAQDTFRTTFDYALEEFAEILDDEIFVRPSQFKCLIKNPFRSEKRDFPVEFGYRWKTLEINTIHHPDGYELAEAPSNLTIKNEYFSFTRMVTKLKDRLSYTRIFEILKDEVAPAHYSKLRSEFARVVDADQEQVVFRPSGT